MGFKVSYFVLSSFMSLSVFPVLLNARRNGYFSQDYSSPLHVQTMKMIRKSLPPAPLVYSNEITILDSSSNATQDGGSMKDTVCTTPAGYPGKCLDLSGCPSLLSDINNLRRSWCFKALFIPGVCCPDQLETPPSTKPEPPGITGARPTSVVEENTATLTTTPTVVRELDSNLANNSRDRECGKSEASSYRIVNGDNAAPGQWPWMAAIFLHGPKGEEFYCGGSLISKSYILTAAHCTKDRKQKSFSARQLTVRLGEYDLMQNETYNTRQTFRVTEIIAHKDFSGVDFYNDLALLKLERDVVISRYVSPICLPTGTGTGSETGKNGSNNFVGTTPTVIGWGTGKFGRRETTALKQVNLPVWSNADCDRAYFQPITNIFLCAGYPQGGKSACQGDSGGPLMLELDGRWVQIGIVSFGHRCAEPGYPGVYTRVTQFLSWIDKNTI